MSTGLLIIPLKLRLRIYEYVLCTQGSVHIIPSSARNWKTPGAMGWETPRFAQRVELNYPPSEPNTGDDNDRTSDSGESGEQWEDTSDAGSAAEDTGEEDASDEGTGKEDMVEEDTVDDGLHSDTLHPNDDGDAKFEHLLMRSEGPTKEEVLFEESLIFRGGVLTLDPTLCDEFDEEEDNGTDEDTSEDEDEDEGGDFKTLRSRLRGSRYKMETMRPFDLRLLRVNRQINREATPIFYSGVNFVPDADPGDTIRFFKTLPPRALQSISTITITDEQLLGDDGPSRRCWTGNDVPPLTTGCPSMSTPFGAFLATDMPHLTDVYLYTPIGGDEDWYCVWAPTELCKMLCHGKLQRLHYVFMGSAVAKALRTIPNSKKCFNRIFETLGRRTAEHEYDLHYPPPNDPPAKSEKEHERLRKRTLKWFDDRDAYVKQHNKLFAWKWGDRRINMGSSGNAQAVITTWMK